jgi:hypothetical protein
LRSFNNSIEFCFFVFLGLDNRAPRCGFRIFSYTFFQRIYAPKLHTRDNITKFAAGISGGFKYALNNNIGLRLQANLNFPIIDAGASLWWSPGSGVDVGVSSYTPIMQFGFTGGLVFMLAK